MNIFEKDQKYIASTYKRKEVCFVSGKKSILTDSKGKNYIDFGSGIAVSSFGISDNNLVDAISGQARLLTHTSNHYYTLPQVELAELLVEKSGMSKVFFGNSGAEANEAAIKCARKYSFDKYGEGRYEIITLVNSFHGRTMATITATGQDVFHQYFNPFLEGFVYAAADFESVKNAITAKTCAVMIELVQGEGGVIALDKTFVTNLASFCKENDILLIVDEVQTGIGRSGWFYAYQGYGILPDIVTSAKGLAGGLPIGATLFGEKTKDVFTFSTHGTTFGGNPVCCAAGYSVVSRIDDNLLESVKDKGNYMKEKLLALKGVESVTGLGLMIGVLTTKPVAEVVDSCQKKGLIVLSAKNKVRIMPALDITYDLIDKGIEILNEVLNETFA